MEKYQLKNLYTMQKYDEIIELYDDDHSTFTEWDYYFTIEALNRKKMYEKIIECFDELLDNYPGFENATTDDRFCWALYYVYIKDLSPENPADDEAKSAMNDIKAFASNTKYSAKWKTIEKYFKTKIVDYDFADEFLDSIDVNSLSEEAKEYNINGREIESSSDKEKWYKYKSKTLLKLGKYQECIEVIRQSLQAIKEFHSNNDLWLKMDMIECLLELDDVEEAEKVMNDILDGSKKRHFSHWCIIEKSFDIQVAKSNTELAVKNGAQCSLADPTHKMRVTFYMKYAVYLQSIGMMREAALLCRFVQLLREENGWGEIELPEGIVISDDILVMDRESVLKELNVFWHAEADKGKVFKTGVVKRLLQDGFSGFVTEDGSNRDYYFSMRDVVDKRDKSAIKEGVTLRYTIEERMDRKKGIMKPNAVEISIVR